MPDPVEPAPLTAAEEAKWREEFERLGRQAVHDAAYVRPGINPQRKYDLALRWLREKEIAAEKRERNAAWFLRWTFWAVILTLLVAAVALPPERVDAIRRFVADTVSKVLPELKP